MEEKVYTVNWTHTADGWTLWVKGRRDWLGAHEDLAKAEKALVWMVTQNGGAQNVVWNYDPPMPLSDDESRFGEPELYLIAGNAGFDSNGPDPTLVPAGQDPKAYEEWQQSFYQSPFCKTCGHQPGPRTDKPLTVTAISQGTDAAAGQPGNASRRHYIFSSEFLGMLTPNEKATLEFREVEWFRTRRRRFFELVGPAGMAEVAVRGLGVKGWYCPDCGYRCFGHWGEDRRPRRFAAMRDVPNPLPSMLTVESGNGLELCVTGNRWRELLGRKATRGVLANRLEVVPDELVLRDSELPNWHDLQRAAEMRRRERAENWRPTLPWLNQ